MRREGRVTGNLRMKRDIRRAAKEQYEQEMQDLGFSGPFNCFDADAAILKVLNKPTNASKCSGRCKRTACLGCHASPPSKALSKTKGLRNKSWRKTWKDAHYLHMHCYSLDSLQDYVDTSSDVYYEGYDIPSDEEDAYVAGKIVEQHQHEAGCEDHDGDGHDVNTHCSTMMGMASCEGGDGDGHDVDGHDCTIVRLGVLRDQPGSLLHYHSLESTSQQQARLSHGPDHLLPCNDDNGSIEWCLIAHPDEEPGEDDSWILC